jgi:hypothetical protein
MDLKGAKELLHIQAWLVDAARERPAGVGGLATRAL